MKATYLWLVEVTLKDNFQAFEVAYLAGYTEW